MKKELEDRIFKEFPHLFNRTDRNQSLMCFGFEHGDGWFDIVYNLTKQLDELAKDENIKFEILQIKEKFGTLRYYPSLYSSEMEKLIEQAEELSANTCEVCGSTKDVKLRGDYWVSTQCEICWNPFLQKIKKANESTLPKQKL